MDEAEINSLHLHLTLISHSEAKTETSSRKVQEITEQMIFVSRLSKTKISQHPLNPA